MGIRFIKFGRGSFSKKARTYIDPKMARDVEIAREKAYCDAYLSGHGIG